MVFSLGMQAKEDVDTDKRQQEMIKNGEELRASFTNAANEAVKYFNNVLVYFLAKNYLNRIAEIDSQISEIRNMEPC